MEIFLIITGAVLLLAGRRLYWLFVGVVGFVVGYTLATNWLSNLDSWIVLIIGVLVGVLGAWLAHAFQRLMMAVVGFLVGGWALLQVGSWLNLGNSFPEWGIFLVGGLIGLFLVAVVFDWALILLSTIGGALLISNNLDLSSQISILVTIGLIVIGILVQSRLSRH